MHCCCCSVQSLAGNGRPKGLSGVPVSDVAGCLLTLVIVGEVTDHSATSSVFVPSSVTTNYQLSLQLRSRQLPLTLLASVSRVLTNTQTVTAC